MVVQNEEQVYKPGSVPLRASAINLESRVTTCFSRILPSNSREQRSDVGLLGIAAHSMLVSPARRRLVSVAVTKHYCLTAINRCGALCCPDFPHLAARQTDLLRAVYGNRTRLLGLGSRCTTDVLTPHFAISTAKLLLFFDIRKFLCILFVYIIFFVVLRHAPSLRQRYMLHTLRVGSLRIYVRISQPIRK